MNLQQMSMSACVRDAIAGQTHALQRFLRGAAPQRRRQAVEAQRFDEEREDKNVALSRGGGMSQ
jgi:hypothetical protein